jgi:hypothetical protein
MVFDYIFRLRIGGISWMFFAISIAHWLFNIHVIYAKIFKFKNNEAETNKRSYKEVRDTFFAEYDRCNPITQA